MCFGGTTRLCCVSETICQKNAFLSFSFLFVCIFFKKRIKKQSFSIFSGPHLFSLRWCDIRVMSGESCIASQMYSWSPTNGKISTYNGFSLIKKVKTTKLWEVWGKLLNASWGCLTWGLSFSKLCRSHDYAFWRVARWTFLTVAVILCCCCANILYLDVMIKY